MAEIRRRQGKKATTYTAVVRLPGHPSMARTFRRRTDALQWAGSTEAAIREHRLNPEQERRRVTVADLLADYDRTVLATRTGGDVGLRRQQLAWWCSELGNVRVSEVSAPAIAACRDRLARGEGPSGRPASAATQRRYLAALSHALSWAVRERGVADNVVRRVTRPKEPQGRLPTLSTVSRITLNSPTAIS